MTLRNLGVILSKVQIDLNISGVIFIRLQELERCTSLFSILRQLDGHFNLI